MSHPPTSVANEEQRESGLNETGRVEAFSDGVFAIAITLLVLDLRLPTPAPGSAPPKLSTELFALWPQYLAFFVSFAFIGIMWINHHRLFTHIARVDTVLLVFNLLLLLGVTVVPFPTSVLAEHLSDQGAQPAALVYSGLFLFIAVAFNLLWRYAAGGSRLLDPRADPVVVGRITRQYLFGPSGYLAAFLLAFVSVPLSLLLSLVLAIFFALPPPALIAGQRSF